MLKPVPTKLDHAYEVYLYIFDKYKLQKSVFWSRMIECSINEAGLNGTSTNLISIEALESKIKKAKKIPVSNLDNVSLEHPITFKVLALHALNRSKPLTFNNYIKLWQDNLITTIVTAKQNKALIKYQKMFKFGVDCWKKMYKQAGIILVENPDLRNEYTRKHYGLQKINRGRKRK